MGKEVAYFPVMTDTFPPHRTAALERLTAFVPKAGYDYARMRNYDYGPGKHTQVSGLSPYLRCRLITETEVLHAVLSRHSFSALEKFVQEVFWRTYWKGWLELRPAVWDQYQATLTRQWDAVQTQSGLRQRWEAACLGESGIDCFDAWAKELAATGYLHNHARMWFASIWIFTLDLPWELGADFFLRHLLDGDPASNTLGWRWVAGIQTPGKTYLARTSNISKYTEGRFHPKWQLATEAHAKDGPPLTPAGDAPLQATVDPNLRTGFLWHEEDLSPSYMLGTIKPAATAMLTPQCKVGPLRTSDTVREFRQSALNDSVARYADSLPKPRSVDGPNAIADWASDENLEQIITPYAPVGPVAQILKAVALNADAPRLCQCIRGYDQKAWPFATKGFFPFKKKIPELLEYLQGIKAA